MKEVLVTTIPRDVKPEDFEDFLVTRTLFIEYFNSFLSSPTFPEPLCFNRSTVTFDIISEEEKKLSNELKMALRATKKPKPIYKCTRDHSFSAIPLHLIDDARKAPPPDIKTVFTVKTLNREQGIQWVKRERLPQFLTSRWYHEYRLAVLVGQAHKFTRTSETQQPVLVKVERAKDKEQKVEIKLDQSMSSEEDENELMMHRMFVSLGDTPTTQTEQWLTQARAAHTGTTQTTPSCNRPTTTARPLSAVRPQSAVGKDKKMGSHGDADNEIEALKLRNLIAQNDITSSDIPTYAPSLLSTTGDQKKGSEAGGKHAGSPDPVDPHQSNSAEICAVAAPNFGRTRVYKPSPGRLDVSSADLNFDHIDKISESLVLDTMKTVLCDMTGFSEQELISSKTWRACWVKDEEPGPIPEASIPGAEVSGSKEHVQLEPDLEVPPAPTAEQLSVEAVVGERDFKEEVEKVLDSEEEYESDGRDDFFKKGGKKGRKPKPKPLDLTSLKGVKGFVKFLQGTEGEKDWKMWVDIELAKSITEKEELNNFLNSMRETFHRTGAPLQLPKSRLISFELTEPTKWTLPKLISIQALLAEQLLLYWAPRFLLSQIIQRDPRKKALLHSPYLQFLNSPFPANPPYNPAVATLLPHRPRTCMPRLHVPEVKKIPIITDAALELLDSPFYVKKSEYDPPKTKPPTAQPVEHDPPDWYTKWQKLKPDHHPPLPHPPPKMQTFPEKARLKSPRKLVDATLRVTGKGILQRQKQDEKARTGKGADHRLRRNSITSSKSSLVSDVSTEFSGGRRMESLMKALNEEKGINGWIRKYITATNNKTWLSCLNFWESVQEFHHLFFVDLLNEYDLKRKSKSIYMAHLGASGDEKIDAPEVIRKKIYAKLDPPYDDLFDEAEEHVLNILFDAWCQLLQKDMRKFSKVKTNEVRRPLLDPNSKILAPLKRRGMLKERSASEESLPTQTQADVVYNQEELLQKVPEEFRDWTLNRLVHSRLELEQFRKFLQDNYASTDLMCWMDIEAFRRMNHAEEKKREAKSKDIKAKYFNKKYFFGPNSPAGREGQEKVIQASGGWGKLLSDQLKSDALIIAQAYVGERLEKKWLLMFLATEEFAERQKPVVGVDSVADDVITIKRKKSQAIWKMLENKWVTSSKDIMGFRKALANPLTAHQFKRYMSIKGDNFENDVTFYLEVQKYKDLCHLHSDRSLIQQKTLAIINCFIDSPIPPPVQIDITPEMAERLLERKMEASPYLFLEAQLTVFRVMLSYWSEFCAFRSNLTEEKLMPTIERHRKRARELEKKKQRQQEEKKADEEARRLALGLPPGANPDDVYDPFTDGQEGEDDHGVKQWSYSQYVAGMDTEETLNAVDSRTFASLESKLSDNAEDVISATTIYDSEMDTEQLEQ